MIDTSKIYTGIAVKCTSEDEAEELFGAMGWDPHQFSKLRAYSWDYDMDHKCYTKYIGSMGWKWNGMCEEDGRDSGYKVIDFETLKITAPKSRLASLFQVAEGQSFYFNDTKFYIQYEKNSTPVICCAKNGEVISVYTLFLMIDNVDEILPVLYSKGVVADAKAAIHLGFNSVMTPDGEQIFLRNPQKEVCLKNGIFVNIPKGKRIALDDIVEYGERE